MVVIDARVLDYGFQPIVNRFAKHPFDFAMSTAIGGCVMNTVALSTFIRWENATLSMLALMAIFCQGFALGVLNVAMWRLRPHIVPGVRNPLRYLLLRVRLGIVFTVLWLSLIVIVMLGPSLAGGLVPLGGLFWCMSFYFKSCDCPPFKPKRVRRRVPSGPGLKLADL